MNKKTKDSIYEYLNLDLDNIPEYIKNKTNINIKSSEINHEKNYKVYKHIPINDIEIIFTNSRRLDPPVQKIEKMSELSYYLNKKNEDEYESFLDLLNNASIDEIEEVEKFQKSFKNSEPSKIKYYKDYLWQIYYIEKVNKYCMIVPLQETEQQCFLYLLKKKISKSKEKIYVPICNMDCSGKLANKSKISSIENNLYFFTKEWPNVFEVSNSKGEISLNIIGTLYIYENIKSDYKITFCDEQNINKFHDLLKSLFYLQTELSNYYKFNIFIDESGKIHFYYNNNEINFESLEKFYMEEIEKNLKSIEDVEKIQINLSKKLNTLKIEEKKLNAELSIKQKQIATFLECRKTFFGRVKYFFKYSKKKNPEIKTDNIESEEIEEDAGKILPNYSNDLEDLIYICKDLRTRTTVAATTRLDYQNLKIKIKILKKKIENATKYIEEIDSHKKSIFEFWKWTNKDEKNQLSEGISEIEEENKIEKNFDIKDDLKDLGKYLDLVQRKNLSLEEQNSIFIASIIGIENITKPENDLKNLLKRNKPIALDDGNITHREKQKDITSILGSLDKLTKEISASKLKEIYKNIDNAFKKCTVNTNLSLYSLEKPINRIMMFEIDPDHLRQIAKSEEIYRVNIKNGTNILALTNIIFFNNRNDTLPIGMNYSTNVFLDLRKTQIINVSTITNNIIELSETSPDFIIKNIKISEFNI